jgi:signal peptidase II
MAVTLIFIIGLVVVVLDQVSKFWVRSSLYYGESIPVIDGFFNLVYVRNPGAAWGMFGDHTPVLIVLAAVIAVLVIVFRNQLFGAIQHRNWVLGLLLGGIFGNLIDRIRFRWVTDFLDFHIGPHHWPSFNVADSAICLAMALYLVMSYLHDRAEKATKGVLPEKKNG